MCVYAYVCVCERESDVCVKECECVIVCVGVGASGELAYIRGHTRKTMRSHAMEDLGS